MLELTVIPNVITVNVPHRLFVIPVGMDLGKAYDGGVSGIVTMDPGYRPNALTNPATDVSLRNGLPVMVAGTRWKDLEFLCNHACTVQALRYRAV
jgi:hypothetical protein